MLLLVCYSCTDVSMYTIKTSVCTVIHYVEQLFPPHGSLTYHKLQGL